MTGGTPKSTSVYYDVEYSHKTDEPGAACTPGQPATGGDVVYDSPDDALANVNDFINPRGSARLSVYWQLAPPAPVTSPTGPTWKRPATRPSPGSARLTWSWNL